MPLLSLTDARAIICRAVSPLESIVMPLAEAHGRVLREDVLAPEDLPDYFQAEGMVLLAIDHRHAVTAVDPAPDTRDPFDRMLLAQCAVEGLRLVTIDRVLAAHPLAWRP